MFPVFIPKPVLDYCLNSPDVIWFENDVSLKKVEDPEKVMAEFRDFIGDVKAADFAAE